MVNEIYKNYGSVNQPGVITIPCYTYTNSQNTNIAIVVNGGLSPVNGGSALWGIAAKAANASAYTAYNVQGLPNKSTITSVSVNWRVGGTAGTPRTPTVKPQVNLYRHPLMASGVNSTNDSTYFTTNSISLLGGVGTLGGLTGSPYPSDNVTNGSTGYTWTTSFSTIQSAIVDNANFAYMVYLSDEVTASTSQGINLYFYILVNYTVNPNS